MGAIPWYLRKPIPVKTRPGIMDAVERLWRMRPCFICDGRGFCMHREFEVAIAELEAHERRRAA